MLYLVFRVYRYLKVFKQGDVIMKIKIIIPNSGMSPKTLKEREAMLKKIASINTDISVDCIKGGPESIESNYDEALASIHILDGVAKAEKDGFDAVIIYCGSDPALEAARELVDIPVVGPGKASILMVNDLSYRYSILTVLEDTIASDREHVRKCGDITRLASIRSIGIPVSDVRDDMERTNEALLDAGRKAIEIDGAHALVLSCLGMAGMGERLQEALGVPVIDPAFLAVKYAELLVTLRLRQSRLSYTKPRDKSRI
jgi:allantoin racemase